MTIGSAGGRARAITQHQKAIASFIPKTCLQCGNEIVYVEGGIKISQIRLKKYCNLSCAARHRHHKGYTVLKKKRFCERCHDEIINALSPRRRFCTVCLPIVRSEKAVNSQHFLKSKFEPGFFRAVRLRQIEHEQSEAKKLEDEGYEVFSPTVVCDRVAVKDGKVFFVEFKKTGQKLRPGQQRIFDLASEMYIVRYS
jgi:hypothetical protein